MYISQLLPVWKRYSSTVDSCPYTARQWTYCMHTVLH